MREGDTLLLRLAPRDPRSLLQGDYMALRYAMAAEVSHAAEAQHLLRFRKRGDSVRLASDAYFFQEGESERHENARYGELRVSDDGDAVLAGLLDRDLHRLPPASP